VNGREQLGLVNATQKAIAATVGVSAESVRLWVRGKTLPSAEQRQAILVAYGIAPESWDERSPTVAERPDLGPMRPTQPASSSTIDRLRAVLADLDADLLRAVTPFDRTKLHATRVSALGKLAELEQGEREDLRAQIDAAIEALAAFPEAREAVAKTWEALR
jgi:transcriptional regulator with XRE-family HTH domain